MGEGRRSFLWFRHVFCSNYGKWSVKYNHGLTCQSSSSLMGGRLAYFIHQEFFLGKSAS